MPHDPRPTWQLLLDAARSLTASGKPIFARADLIADVHRVDPTRERGSIDPIIQGMTINAMGGPRSACGEVFVKVERGRYRLADPRSAPPPPPSVRRPASVPAPPSSTEANGRAGRRIGLVGCVKEKATTARPAQDLYVSTLFAGRRAFVERTCDEWWILSAEHGLVHPTQFLAPYDASLKGASRALLRRWSAGVMAAIESHIGPRTGDVFEFHAGAEYRDFSLADALRAAGCVVENPTEHMGIGEQLAFYNAARTRR